MNSDFNLAACVQIGIMSTMPKPRTRKSRRVPKARPAKRLQDAIAKLPKEELVKLVLDLAGDDSGIRRKLESRFQSHASAQEIVKETAAAIAEATDFDEREINRNFSYDYKAYELVERNFRRLVELGCLREAMGLSLELMRQGSYQVEMSDEGLMTDEIEQCLRVVIKALQNADLPQPDVSRWCREMLKNDRVGFICQEELRSLQDYFGGV